MDHNLSAGPRELIEKLQAIDLDRIVKLPEIAVMGDTSAGKSSVLSAIAGIEFPKNAGLTTRCPMRLILKRSSGGAGGGGGGGAGGNKSNSNKSNKNTKNFFEAKVDIAWKDPIFSDTTTPKPWPVETCTCVEDLTAVMEKAQQHIVTAGPSPRELATDVIEIKISATTVSHDLTLIDLPGFVSSTADYEDKDLGKNIKRMITSFLENPRCIIVAVHDAAVDYHNSSILNIAKDADKDQLRTLVVVTKPDLVNPGAEEEEVMALVRGEKISFKHGFHVVKSRSQKNLNEGMNLAAAREMEGDFFKGTEPWDRLDEEVVGVACLQQRLSELQRATIVRQLPEITDDVKQKLEVAREQLHKFPEVATATERRKTLREVFSVLRKDVDALTERGPQVRRVITDKKKDFAAKLLTLSISRENLRMAAEVRNEHGRVVAHRSSSVAAERVVAQALDNEEYPVMKGTVGESGTQVVRRTDGAKGELLLRVPVTDKLAFTEHSYVVFFPASEPAVVCTLLRSEFQVPVSREMLESVRNHQARGLNASSDEQMITELVGEFVEEHVQCIAKQLADDCGAHVEKTITPITAATFADLTSVFQGTSTVPMAIGDIVQRRRVRLQDELAALVRVETVPHTQNHYFQSQLTKNRNKDIFDELMRGAQIFGTNTGDHTAVSVTNIKAIFARTEKLSNDEFVAREAANILEAYWKVAAKKLGDTIPERVDQDLTKGLGAEIYALFEDLDDENLERLFRASKDVERKRTKLKKDVETLTRSLKVIIGEC